MRQEVPSENRSIHMDIRSHLLALSSQRRPTKVELHWVPSHIGITVNEKADKLAEEGGVIDEATDEIEPTFSHFRGLCERYITESFHTIARESTSPSIMRYLQINPRCEKPNLSVGGRKEQVQLTNLRVSSLSQCTHRCKDPPICTRCGEPFSSTHYLLHCPAAQEMTQLSKEFLTPDESDTLSDDEQAAMVLMAANGNPTRFHIMLEKYPISAKCKAEHNVLPARNCIRQF